MAHPSQSNRPSFVRSLAGHNSYPIIPDSFFTAHLEGQNDVTKLKLTSDASDIFRTWEVKLNGRIFAGGWEDFSAGHCLRDDDVLVFRHDGEMVFHVTPSGRSFSQIHCISSSSGDDDNEDNDDDGEDDDDETGEDDSDSKNLSSKKESRLKAESSSSENSCLLGVTASNLRLDRVNKMVCTKECVRLIMNLSGKSWALLLRHNNITDQEIIRGGWSIFCRANELKPGSLYRFKLVRNGTRPLLRLCSDISSEGNCSKANGKENVSEMHTREGESAFMKQNKFLTVTYKHYMLKSGNLRLPRQFVRKNGIKETGEITLVDKNGGKWPSYVAFAKGRGDFYLAKGWRRFCAANRLKTGETFTLEFVRGEGTTPMLKFCSKAKFKIKQAPMVNTIHFMAAPLGGPKRRVQASRDETEEAHEETNTRFQKRARVSAEGPSRRTLASNESSSDPKNLQRKQLLQPCSISDHVTKVKQSIVVALTDVRRIRSELEIKEQHLEASLKEIDALGEKVSEINKILE